MPMGIQDIQADNVARDSDIAIAVSPLPHSFNSVSNVEVSAGYRDEVDPATVTPQSFSVQGQHTGSRSVDRRIDANTVSLNPDTPFLMTGLAIALRTADKNPQQMKRRIITKPDNMTFTKWA